jgi:5-methylcytosine-specific restriction protein A
MPGLPSRGPGKSNATGRGMKRQEFSRRTKLAAFDRCGGRCEACGAKLQVGRIEFDHLTPCELGGTSAPDNCWVLCRGCHRDKTQLDVATMAKSRAARARHVGARNSSRPLPCGRKSPWKKKISGEVVPR